MNPQLSKLLDPISESQPCGPDLSYDPLFNELEAIALGKPEIEIGSHKAAAEPPDWRELKKKSVEFLGQSKHLRIGVLLCCSLLKTDGLPGFADGLALIRAWIERFWGPIYPLLDPEDNNDPTQRLNILATLSPRREAMGLGWLTVLQYLADATLCAPKGGAAVSFELLQAAKHKASPPANGSGAPPPNAPDLSKVEALIRAAGSDQIAATHSALSAALEAVNGLDQFLTTTLGAGNTISFETLQKTLEQMLAALKPYLLAAPDRAGLAEPEAAPEPSAAAPSAPLRISGSIRSREDVARAIETICAYYRQAEPSSPVPYLLRRAQKLALMNFVEVVQELNLGSADTLRPSLGSAVENLVPPDATNPPAA